MGGSWIAAIESTVDYRFFLCGLALALFGPLLARGPNFGMTFWFLRDGVPLGRRGRIWATVSFELVAAAMIVGSFWQLYPLDPVPQQGSPALQHVLPWPVFLFFVAAIGNFFVFLNWTYLYALYVRRRR